MSAYVISIISISGDNLVNLSVKRKWSGPFLRQRVDSAHRRSSFILMRLNITVVYIQYWGVASWQATYPLRQSAGRILREQTCVIRQ